MESESPFCVQKGLQSVPIQSHIIQSTPSHISSLRSVLIVSAAAYVFKEVSSISIFPTEVSYMFLISSVCFHAPSTLTSFKYHPHFVVVSSMKWNAFQCSNTGTVYSNPIRGTDVCFSACVALYNYTFCDELNPPTKDSYEMSKNIPKARK
jgi:hypothetical protein